MPELLSPVILEFTGFSMPVFKPPLLFTIVMVEQGCRMSRCPGCLEVWLLREPGRHVLLDLRAESGLYGMEQEALFGAELRLKMVRMIMF